MSQARNIRSNACRAFVLALGLALGLTSCSLWPPQNTTAAAVPGQTHHGLPLSVEVEFPGRDDLQATTTPVEQTMEMTEVLPAGSKVHDMVDINLVDGTFPDTGATVTFDMNDPIAEGAFPPVVRWNEDLGEWEPLATTVAEDRMSLAADVDHFSTYAWWEGPLSVLDPSKGRTVGAHNWLNNMAGNYAAAPVCPNPEPEWSDVTFHDHKNAPLLWCVGTAEDDKNLLEVRMVVNRPSAVMVSTAIEPVKTWDNILGATGAQTWAAMALGGNMSGAGAYGQYVVPPLGEYRLYFSKDDLMEFHHSGENRPVLIQADTSLTTVAGGFVYNVLAGKAEDKAIMLTMFAAMHQCSKTLAATDGTSGTSTTSAIVSCLDGHQDQIKSYIEVQARDHAEEGWEDAQHQAAKNLKRLRFATQYYLGMKGFLAIGDILNDETMNPMAHQLHFVPSIQAIRDQAEDYTTAEELCGNSCTITSEQRINHPEWGQVTLKTLLPEEGLPAAGVIAVVNATGNVIWSKQTAGVMKLLPAGTVQDSTGNVFLNYNSGRYNGVTVLRPTTDGFDGLGTLPTEMHDARFYYSVTEEGPNGQVVIWKFNNSCDPSCAGGGLTKQKHQWKGTDYAPVGSAQDGSDWPDELYSSEP